MALNYKFKLHSSSKWEHAYIKCTPMGVSVFLLVFLSVFHSHFESVQMHELHQAIGGFIWQLVQCKYWNSIFAREIAHNSSIHRNYKSHWVSFCCRSDWAVYVFLSRLLYNFIVTVLLWSPWSLAATDGFIYAFRFIVLHTKRAKHELFMLPATASNNNQHQLCSKHKR